MITRGLFIQECFIIWNMPMLRQAVFRKNTRQALLSAGMQGANGVRLIDLESGPVQPQA